MSEHSYPGSRWWKFDFHNHTPASSDYDQSELHTLQPRDWLLAYMRKGIDCVAITDHNSSDWIEKLQFTLHELNNELPKPEGYRPLTLFPGAELTTADSLHILAVFSPETTKANLDGLLRGKLNLSNPGKPTAELMFSESASTIVDCIHDLQGLAIAAHVEKDNGLLQGTTDDSGTFSPKMPGRSLDDVLSKVDALEFQTTTCPAFQHFESRIKHLAWVAGSDSPHRTTNTGRRFTWIKMSSPNLEGLRLALLDPESAVRRSDQALSDPQPLPGQWITSVKLENMHLRRNGQGPLRLDFNPAYNAVIGGRGSGKLTVLECLRLAMARDNELRKLGEDSDIWKTFQSFKSQYKAGIMLPDTCISVEVLKGQGESGERLKYIWNAANSNAQVWRWDEDNWQETGLGEDQARAAFPIKIFSQKQVLALANNPQALLDYIDDSIRKQKATWQQKFDEKKSALLAARLRVRTLKKELEKKPALELEYKDASRKARVFANANFGHLLKAYQRASQQQRAMEDFNLLLADDVARLQAGLDEAANLAGTELAQFLAETPAEIAARDNALALKNELVKRYEQVAVIVAQMRSLLAEAQAAQAASAWHQENHTHIQAYQLETERLKAEGINSAREAAAAVATEERLCKQLEQIKAYETELVQAEQAVEAAAHELTHCRESLTQLREAFTQQLFAQNDMLKVSLYGMADAKGAVDSLRKILRLPDNARFEDIWQEDEIGQGIGGILWDATDPALAGSVGERLYNMKQDLEAKSKNILRTTLHGALVKRLDVLQPEVFDELAWWFPKDEVYLEYRRKPGATHKDIKGASAGQKTAAMLSFLLVHGDEPLLLDQPEDDLDNALITELVVEQLRKNKWHRQLLVVTHNANIVVNADAELVMTMDFNGQINLASAGGLQERSVRTAICEIMEGGEKAFRQRYKRILQDLEGQP